MFTLLYLFIVLFGAWLSSVAVAIFAMRTTITNDCCCCYLSNSNINTNAQQTVTLYLSVSGGLHNRSCCGLRWRLLEVDQESLAPTTLDRDNCWWCFFFSLSYSLSLVPNFTKVSESIGNRTTVGGYVAHNNNNNKSNSNNDKRNSNKKGLWLSKRMILEWFDLDSGRDLNPTASWLFSRSYSLSLSLYPCLSL